MNALSVDIGNRLFSLMIAIWFFCFVAFSCGGGGGSDSGNGSEPTYNATGVWTFTMTPDAGSLDTNTDCEIDDPSIEGVLILQNGNELTVVNVDGNSFEGTVSGNKYTFAGTFNDPDTGYPISVSGTVNMESTTSLSGSMTARIENGALYCQWNTNFTAVLIDPNSIGQGTIDSRLYGWWLEYDSSFSAFQRDGIAGLTNDNVFDLECNVAGWPTEDCDWQIDWFDLEYQIINATNGIISYIDNELGGTHIGIYSIDENKLILTSDNGVTRYYRQYEGGSNYDDAQIDDDQDGYTENQGDCRDSADDFLADTIYPGAEEICGDFIDQDCDGEDLECE